MQQDETALKPLDVSKMTLDDVDKLPNDVLHTALESVIRQQGPESLTHQSHKSHSNKL